MNRSTHPKRARRLFAVVSAIAIALLAIAMPMTTASAASPGPSTVAGLAPGSIKHVWLIILENKSYDETFTGLNYNSYLWQTLPSEGVLLKNYYGTGHSSEDNYIALASGQGPEEDVQEDCSSVNSPFGSNSTIQTTGAVGSYSPNWNYGQVLSSLGANAPLGATPSTTNGCTYPTEIPTLFDQFNAAGVSWKGYAQDLGGAQPIGSTSFVSDSVPGRDDGLCGAPGSSLNNPVSAPTYLSGAQGYPIGAATVSSTLTSAATTYTLTDSTQTWTTNEYQGGTVTITGGTGNGQSGTVVSNTANTLTITGLTVEPDSTTAYTVQLGSSSTSSTATGGAATTTVLTDSTQTFTSVDKGYTVEITGGTGKGEGGTVTAETATTLTLAGLPITPDSTATYELGPADTSSYTSASLVAGSGSTNNPQYSDQYVAKHFPFPWFASLTGGGSGNPLGAPLTQPQASAGGGTNCDSNHIANLDDPNHGLVHDLNANTVPQFSWITPDNCSDAHDTTCKGNNLSGAFGTYSSGPHAGQVNLNDPIYDPPGLPVDDPEATTPINYTGGLYAADLFLAYYVPLIEQSSAYANGGLIDITFDEGEPSFTYSGNSFNNVLTNTSSGLPTGQGTSSPQSSAPADAPTYGTPGSTAPGADSIFGAYGISADAAGENISGTNVYQEPTGPNSTLGTNSSGDQLYPGPGNNSFIDRPPSCASSTAADCVTGIVEGGAGSSPGARTDTVTGGGGSSTISYPNPSSGNPSLVGDDTGREITSITINGTPVTYGSSAYNTDFPNGLFVGTVSDSGELYPTNSGGPTVGASFQAITDAGNPVSITGTVTQVKLSAEGDPALIASESTSTAPVTADPLFDATDPTPGGGDTGSVLISPYITPGTSTTTNYNHYSWLRTMEDLFDVSSCVGSGTNVSLPTGSVCGGLDGQGHIGYAAQTGLEPFGSDVFSAPSGDGFTAADLPVNNPGEGTPEAPLAVALPALGLLFMGGYVLRRRRRNGTVS